MTEFFLSVLKIVGLCLAFAMTILQEKQHPREQPSDSKRRITVALLILGLTVAVGAEIADLFNKAPKHGCNIGTTRTNLARLGEKYSSSLSCGHYVRVKPATRR